ncbi:MAG TPA: 50S ribosomal protein L4 [Clostridiales bacterium]|nr:50S ribosomal protein L4 [Clostridiales bacterium]
MPRVDVYNVDGEVVGEVELSDALFGAEVNEALMHQAVTAYLAAQRRGTASTKGRSEVRGGGRKPWRQKGTGLARAGSIRSPIWRGGGITFGPKPRDYTQALPKRMRRKALSSALSAKVRDGSLLVLDTIRLEEPKTKKVVSILEKLNVKGSALIVTPETDRTLVLSARNIPGVETRRAEDLNVYDLLGHAKVLMTRDAVARVEEVFGS